MVFSPQKYAPIFARIGLGAVFFLIGIDQLIRSGAWIGYLPSFIISGSLFGISPESFLIINGLFDALLGLLLLAGLFTRVIAAIMALHLAGVITSLGYNDLSIRDFGLLMLAVAVALHGADSWCLNRKLKKEKRF